MGKHPSTLPMIKSKIFQYIAQRLNTSKEAIQQALDLPNSTAGRLLQEMVEQGLITPSGFGPSKGGRRPLLYNVNEQYGYIIGIEISRFYATIGLFDLSLNAKSIVRWRMDSSMTPSVFIQSITSTMRLFMKDHELRLEQIIGIGIGSIGPLDRNKGIIINPVHFSADGWEQLEITHLMQEATGIKTILDNGTDCAAIAEQLAFRMQNIEANHLLYVNAGVGLRSSMISGGKLVQGGYDREGAFGDMIIRAGDPPILMDARPGALENYVSIPALVEQYKIQYRLGRTGIVREVYPPIVEHRIDFELLIRELRNENEVVKEIFQQSALYLGIGVANLINTFQPDKVILGGALISPFKPYSKLVASTAHKYTYNALAYQAQFVEGILVEDAVATGAALLVRNHMF